MHRTKEKTKVAVSQATILKPLEMDSTKLVEVFMQHYGIQIPKLLFGSSQDTKSHMMFIHTNQIHQDGVNQWLILA
jgi:hypothetical protein